MNPENIYYLFEAGTKVKQEDYIWPLAGKATLHDKIFIVCDGSGNFYGGEVASELICRFMAAKVLRFGEQKMSGELIDKLLKYDIYLGSGIPASIKIVATIVMLYQVVSAP